MNVFTIGISCVAILGAADILGAKMSRQAGPLLTLFWTSLTGWLALLGYMTISGDIERLAVLKSSQDLALLGLGGCFSTAGYLVFFNGMEKGRVGLVSALSSTYPLVVIIVGLVLSLVKFSLFSGLGFGLVSAGTILLILEQALSTGRDNIKSSSRRALAYGLPVGLLWGFSLSIISYAVPEAHWMVVVLIARGVSVLISSLLLVTYKTNPFAFKDARTMGVMAAVGLAEIIMYLVLSLGARSGQVIIITSIISTSPILTSLLAFILMKESLSRFQVGALASAVAGIIVLGFAE